MNLLLIGCGTIGGALLNLWAPLNLCKRLIVVQPSLSCAAHFKENARIEFARSLEEVPADVNPDLIVLAVKPQVIGQILPPLSTRTPHAMVVSLLAGVQLAQLASALPQQAKLVRLMPNLAIKFGQSLNLVFSTPTLDREDRATVERVFGPSGPLFWMETEQHLDLLTPVSGSGPAYFFLLAEVLVAETIKLGLPETLARSLIQQVFVGSAHLLAENNHFEDLIQAVSSKKGVTEAALHVMRPLMTHMMEESLKAALARLGELSDGHL